MILDPRTNNTLFIVLVMLASSMMVSCRASREQASQNVNRTGTPPPQTSAAAESGSIKVESKPSGAAVLLISEDAGGAGMPQPRGSTPTLLQDLVPGKYTVHLELRGYRAFQKSVEIKPGETVTVIGTLKR